MAKLAVVPLILLLLISGCTGGSTPPTTNFSPPPPTTPTLKPASFIVSELTSPKDPVVAGQTAQVSAKITNSGEINGTYTASLGINSAEYKKQDLSLAPNESKIVTFVVVETRAGTYKLQIGDAIGSLVVQPIPMSAALIALEDMPVGYKAITAADAGVDMSPSYLGSPHDFFGFSCNNSSLYGIYYGYKIYPLSSDNQSSFDNTVNLENISPQSYANTFKFSSLTVKSWELIPEFSHLGDCSIGIRFHLDNQGVAMTFESVSVRYGDTISYFKGWTAEKVLSGIPSSDIIGFLDTRIRYVLFSRETSLSNPRITTFFSCGKDPEGLAFDGSHVWITNSMMNQVTVVDDDTGLKLATYNVGTSPMGICYDRSNIWVVNNGSDTIMKLNVANGAIVGTYSVGHHPISAYFDGTNIWVSNYSSSTISKIRPSDGQILGTYNVGSYPVGIVSDGKNIWVACVGEAAVDKLDKDTGAIIGSYQAGLGVQSLTWDGNNIWVANFGNNTVTKIRGSDGTNLGTYKVGSIPCDIAFDGYYIWVVNGGSNNVNKITASDASIWTPTAVGINPSCAFFDGTYVWITNAGSNSLTRISTK